MDANKILSTDFLDLLFEGRNKDYGAYNLRRTYNKRITIALAITALVAFLAIGGSFLAKALEGKDDGKLEVKDVVLEDIKVEEEKPVEPPPPPPPKVEPPKVEVTKFTPPKIVEDQEVKKEDIPPETKELETTKIDVFNQEGIKDLGNITPVKIDEGKQVIEVKKEDDENKIFTKVEKEAEFKGGQSAWRRYLERNLDANAPVDNGAPSGQYTVWVQFIVDKAGKISDVKALTKNGYGMEDEAIRVIKKGPDWVPALQNGRNVNAYRKQPITFVVSEQ